MNCLFEDLNLIVDLVDIHPHFQHRKELVDAIHHGKLVLKSEKITSNSQSRMPSYGTQVQLNFK